MHLAIEPHLAQHVGAERFQAAAQVVEGQAGDAPDQPVGELRRQLAQPEAVLPLVAPAGDDVEVFRQQALHQARDVARVVLQVAVHRDDDVAGGGVDAGLHRGGLAEVARELHHADVVADRAGVAAQGGGRRVAAAVVDDDQLPGLWISRQRRLHGVDQRRGVLDLVVHRHHHRQAVGREQERGVGHVHGVCRALVLVLVFRLERAAAAIATSPVRPASPSVRAWTSSAAPTTVASAAWPLPLAIHTPAS